MFARRLQLLLAANAHLEGTEVCLTHAALNKLWAELFGQEDSRAVRKDILDCIKHYAVVKRPAGSFSSAIVPLLLHHSGNIHVLGGTQAPSPVEWNGMIQPVLELLSSKDLAQPLVPTPVPAVLARSSSASSSSRPMEADSIVSQQSGSSSDISVAFRSVMQEPLHQKEFYQQISHDMLVEMICRKDIAIKAFRSEVHKLKRQRRSLSSADSSLALADDEDADFQVSHVSGAWFSVQSGYATAVQLRKVWGCGV